MFKPNEIAYKRSEIMVAMVSGAQNVADGLNTALQQKWLCIKCEPHKKKKKRN